MYYGVNGWVAHHNIDIWRGTAPVDAARYAMWPVGGAWLSQHIWEHYAFTGDKEFLKEYYPVLKGAAQFLQEVLVKDPKHNNWLVTPISMSPEHGFYDSKGQLSYVTSGPTMDFAIIRDLFPHTIEAAKILGVDEEFRGKLEAVLPQLPPYRINSQGNLQEWIEDWKPVQGGHNVSPQFPFFPGNSIQLHRDSDKALVAAVEHQMAPRRGGGGWISAWGVSMWARLERGDKVGAGLSSWIASSPGPNMYNQGSNQCDGTFGFTAGAAEALIQSHAGEVSLLPALPPDWADGSVTGLRARGQYTVDMTWKGGKLVSAVIHAGKDGPVNLRYNGKTATITMKAGGSLQIGPDLAPAAAAKTAEATRSRVSVTLVAETKAAEPKAGETKSAETKPSATKAADAKPAETKPAETKPAATSSAAKPRDLKFDGKISREVLENYLSRSISVEGVFNGRGNLDESIRMLTNVGVKYAGRSLCLWGAENGFLAKIEQAKKEVPKAVAADPEMVLEACVFETVGPRVSQIAIPDWVFKAFNLPVEKRNFVYENIIYQGGGRAMGAGQVPDVSRIETQMWFYYQAASYIDCGFEGIHFGQVEIMNRNDRGNNQWDKLFTMVRDYAAKHARRHWVLLNGHTPSGGLLCGDKCLLDFHAFPLRVRENPENPHDGILQVDWTDAIFLKSKGGISPSGWKCEHLPYLVELDNYGTSRTPGKPGAGPLYIMGYDEITWFSHEPKEYRAEVAEIRLRLGAEDGPQRLPANAGQPHGAPLVLRQQSQPGLPDRPGRRRHDQGHLGRRFGEIALHKP